MFYYPDIINILEFQLSLKETKNLNEIVISRKVFFRIHLKSINSSKEAVAEYLCKGA